jgi:hypothetical protein
VSWFAGKKAYELENIDCRDDDDARKLEDAKWSGGDGFPVDDASL